MSHSSGYLWEDALAAARVGDVQTARRLCAQAREQEPPFAGGHEYLLGRALAESGTDLEEAIELLRKAIALSPKNLMAPHVLTLALMRAGRAAEAAELLRSNGLPHDLTLLAHLSLTMELQTRPWPNAMPPDWPAWPVQLGPDPAKPLPPYEEARHESSAFARPVDAGPSPGAGKVVARIEKLLEQHKSAEIIREVNGALSAGIDSAELQLAGGLAAEEAGDANRARAHLALSLSAEPKMLMARTFLGRVYWRTGWNDLATDLWRSLPVEGPDDYGRHYHLALAHESGGNRADALAAMRIALSDFFIETREFYIERALWRWLHSIGTPAVPGNTSKENRPT